MGTKPVLKGLLDRVEALKREGSKRWRKVAEAIKAAWILEVMGLPDTPERWKRAYIRCLKIKSSNGKAVVVLDTSGAKGADHMYVTAIELGVPKGGIDMKPWLLKDKEFVNIPIMHTEEQRAGYSPTKGHTKTGIERLLTGLGPGERSPEGMVERLQYRYQGHGKTTVTDPLARAIRQTEAFVSPQTGRSSGREGTITTFRRLSKDSPEGSWHWCRKGYAAKHLARRIAKKVGPIARSVMFDAS